jgi:hypothetical protein
MSSNQILIQPQLNFISDNTNPRKSIRKIQEILFLFLRFLDFLGFSVTVSRAARSIEAKYFFSKIILLTPLAALAS